MSILNREDFLHFLNENKDNDIIMKFSAKWCGPCKKIKGLIEELNETYNPDGTNYIFLEIDIDESFDLYSFLRSKKQLTTIPALFYFKKNTFVRDKYFLPTNIISSSDLNQITTFYINCLNC